MLKRRKLPTRAEYILVSIAAAKPSSACIADSIHDVARQFNQLSKLEWPWPGGHRGHAPPNCERSRLRRGHCDHYGLKVVDGGCGLSVLSLAAVAQWLSARSSAGEQTITLEAVDHDRRKTWR